MYVLCLRRFGGTVKFESGKSTASPAVKEGLRSRESKLVIQTLRNSFCID